MRLRRSAPEEFLRGSKGVRLKPGRTQQQFDGAAVARVVLDNSDGALPWGHVWCELRLMITNLRSLRYCPFGQISMRDKSNSSSPFTEPGSPNPFCNSWILHKNSPSHLTVRPNSAGDCTPSFCITWQRCALTVRSEMPRVSAICLFGKPRTTSAKTSRSRKLSLS